MNTAIQPHDPVAQALEEVREANGGTLTPQAVVEAARDNASPLHECFTWDDSEAAEQYRLWEARQLIRVRVVLLRPKDEDTRPIRAYVSLIEDRGHEGYRPTIEVLTDEQRRVALVRQAIGEIAAACKKYEDMELDELGDVFAAVHAVEERARLVGVA